MSNAGHSTQCKMLGLDEAEGQVHVAWLPSRFAVVGKLIDIDGMAGRWRVVERYESKPTEYVYERSRDYQRQREASDV